MYEVVVYSKADEQGQVTILGEVKFADYVSTQLYINNFKRMSKNVGARMINHRGTTRVDDTLPTRVESPNEKV